MESPEVWISKMFPVSSTLISPQLQNHTFTELEGKLCFTSVTFFLRVIYILECWWSLGFCLLILENSKQQFISNCDFFVCLFVLNCRTARADNPGTALSFISHTELGLLSEVEEALTGGNENFHYFQSKCLNCFGDIIVSLLVHEKPEALKAD